MHSGRRLPSRGEINRGQVLYLFVMALIIISASIWFYNRRPLPVIQSGARTISHAEFDELEKLNLTAIAYLENGTLSKARDHFKELLVKLPNERSAIQNLAVCASLTLESAEFTDEVFDEAERDIQAFLTIQPDSPIAHFLEARLLIKSRDRLETPELNEQISASFQRAEAFDPQNAIFPFERFLTINPPPNEPMTSEAFDAIQHAYDMASDNIFVQLDYMLVLARMSDERLPKIVAQFEASLRPHLEGPTPSENVRKSLEDVKKQLADLRSESLPIAVSRLVNNVKPTDLARSDRRRIEPNPLEFVVHELGSVRRPDRQPPSKSSIVVEWSPLGSGRVGSISDAVAIQAIDFDMDTMLDLIVLQPDQLTVLSQKSPQTWVPIIEMKLDIGATGMILADLDRDAKNAKSGVPPFHIADPDLVVYGAGGAIVLKNVLNVDTQERSLELVLPAANTPPISAVTQAAFADLDHDGDLDIVFGCDRGLVLWSNRGDMTFDDISHWSELPKLDGAVTSLVAVDWDRDVDVDIVVAGSKPSTCGILENMRHGHFRFRPTTWNPWSESDWLAVLESDGNVSWDVLLSGQKGTRLIQTRYAPSKISELRTVHVSDLRLKHGILADIDNDGLSDLISLSDGRVLLFRGDSEPEGFALPVELNAGNSVSAFDTGDVDRDGDLDLIVASHDGVFVILNQGGNSGAWIDFRLQGGDEEKVGRVNHFGIGSTIELKFADRYQAQIVTRPITHFGLGNSDAIAVARIIFPNGVPQSIVDPKANQVVDEKQRILTSCPFLYTWNGERFVFCTDLLWNAPLGLQTGDGGLMPDRPWEYLKIDGSNLRARNGKYQLRITEELWEASYFDLVELIAVDHPLGTEIYSNEKVGPASISEFQIHTVQKRETPKRALDSLGRDVLEQIRIRDQVYCQPFEKTLRQGLAEDHFLELDLGALQSPKKITLFLTGWIFPTDCNLNIQIAQNPSLHAPQPPSVWVPNSHGEWVEAIPFMGFPSGKTKTIAIDLSDAFITNDYRLRIRTSAAIRWDEIFFTVDDDPVEVRQTTARLSAAQLRFLGYCEPMEPVPGGPEMFDYQRRHSNSLWPPMAGRLTRYGDVRALLEKVDNQLAVFGAGDEIAIEFDAVPDTPEGWVRDYILHNVGWEKDCLLNTVLGQTVEPMPFQGMSSYPNDDTPLETDFEYQKYLRLYQTRRQHSPDFWRQSHPTATLIDR